MCRLYIVFTHVKKLSQKYFKNVRLTEWKNGTIDTVQFNALRSKQLIKISKDKKATFAMSD